MVRGLSSLSMLWSVLMMVALLFYAVPAQAQDGSVYLKITKASFVVGVGGGHGTLQYGGKTYNLSVSGLKVGLTIGLASVELVGQVTGLTRPGDIEGTYTSATGSATLGGGVSSVTMENTRGVRMSLRGRQVGLEASLDLGGITIRMK